MNGTRLGVWEMVEDRFVRSSKHLKVTCILHWWSEVDLEKLLIGSTFINFRLVRVTYVKF